jgi:hypothetical protein
MLSKSDPSRGSLLLANFFYSIIAVPGLGSHAFGSWKAQNSDEIWLRDFLPEDIPNIRVLLYGYDTKLPGSQSKQSIEDLGRAFLEQITAFRTNDGVSGLLHILIRLMTYRLLAGRSSSLVTALEVC